MGEDHRLAILGDPGSGKSTLVDWLAWQLADEHPNAWKARLGNRIPIPLILRDLRIPRGITWDGVLDAFLTRPLGMHPSREYLLRLMDAGHALVLLDGLDEIGATQTRRDLRDAVLSRFRRFERCLWLLTSRVIGYDDVPFHLAPDLVRTVHNLETDRGQAQTPLVTLAYIAPFGDTQIAQFAKNWYTEREANRESARAAAEQLVQAVHRDPDTLQLARVPNLLTMMALIHRNQASLPHGKTLLYEDIVQAYLKTIDEFRQITEYTDPLQEMKRWLSEVGFKMHQQLVDREAQGIWIDDELPDEVLLFDGDTLRGWLGEAMAGTGSPAAAPDVHQFTDIIKRRSGLIIERGDNQFAFVHLSFQEYFAAVYLAGWVTSAEWLLGEAVPPGTAAADLQRYATNTTWQKTLVFLLELLDGATPLGKKKIREAVFGPEWSAVTGESVPWTASLLARLTSNPHVHWDPSIKASALERCLTVVAEYHDRQYRDRGPELNTDILSVNTGLLRHLLTGESASSRERFQRLVDRWASTGNPRLAPLWIPLTDLSLLARLTNLQYVNLNHTLVTDLSPLAGLTNLRSIVLMSTPVTDLSPLAGLTNLRFLDLGHTSVSDLSPLAGLTNLQFLDLSSTPVTEDEVAKLKARLTGLEVRLSEPMSGNLWSYAEAQSPGAHPPFLEGLSERDECGR